MGRFPGSVVLALILSACPAGEEPASGPSAAVQLEEAREAETARQEAERAEREAETARLEAEERAREQAAMAAAEEQRRREQSQAVGTPHAPEQGPNMGTTPGPSPENHPFDVENAF